MKQEPDEMSARNPDNSEQADDVATLYSWANLHGAKYRDFSASRQQVRTGEGVARGSTEGACATG